MPNTASPLPPHLGESFSCADALQAGVTRRRLRAKDHEAPFHGARLRRDPAPPLPQRDDEPLARDRAQRTRVLRLARAFREVMQPHAFLAGRTAAVVYGAPIEHTDELEVAVLAPARAPRRRGIRGMKVAPALAKVREHEGLRVSSPASTWAMLAADLSVRELVVLGDAFVRVPRDGSGRRLPKEQLATIAQLQRAIEAGPRRGIHRLREAIGLIRVGSASPLESEFRIDSLAAGLPEPELDVEIRDARGRLLGISEIAYPSYRTVVEIEGDHHRTSRAQWNRDIDKYAAYAHEGLEVVRLTSDHIRAVRPRAAAIVRAVLVRRGWQPT